MMRHLTLIPVVVMVLVMALVPSTAAAQDSEGNEGFLLRIEGSERIEENDRIGTAIMIDGDLAVAGAIESVIIGIDSDVHIENGAIVTGDIIMIEGDLTLRDGSRVTGDIVLSSDSRLITETGSEHTGTVEYDAFDFDLSGPVALNIVIGYASIWLVLLIVSLVAAVVFAGVGGRQLQSASDYITARPAGTILSSIGFWIAVSGLSLLLLLTIFAAPLVVPLVLLASSLWFLGMLVAGTRLGAYLLRKPAYDEDVDHPYASALLGTFVLQVIAAVAGGGGLFIVILSIVTDDIGLLGGLIGIPVALLGITAVLAGFLGVGALVYRALHAWSGRTNEHQQVSVRR